MANTNPLSAIQPQAVWRFFSEIAKVPRPSKHEEKIREYLFNFAAQRHLEAVDANGNIIIRKPAAKGMENVPMIALQSHIDMVCEKNADVIHDFLCDPIRPVVEGDWVRAQGTTLGADDGIGVAAELAVLDDDTIKHGPIECVFTYDEEQGLSGAKAFPAGMLQSKYLLNLDSEDDGVFCIGCAGGVDTTAVFSFELAPADQPLFFVRASIKGLKGGHSGCDIHLQRGNAVQILARYVKLLSEKTAVRIVEFQGGNLRNAIAREANALLAVPMADKEQARIVANVLLSDLNIEYASEKDVQLNVESDADCKVNALLSVNDSLRFINALIACPHGVYGMCQDMPGLVETSSNLAAVKMTSVNSFMVTTSQRSSIASRKEEMKQKVAATFVLAGAEVTHGDGYPGWMPNVHSAIKDLLVSAYANRFGEQPEVGAIHAGLECGLFLEKYPDLEMISFGPTLTGVHSPDERANIPTVVKFWDLLLDTLARAAELPLR